jgi:hypothetical protein
MRRPNHHPIMSRRDAAAARRGASIAQAAQARADDCNVAKGIEIALDLAQGLLSEARPRACTDGPCGGAIANNPLFSNYPNPR